MRTTHVFLFLIAAVANLAGCASAPVPVHLAVSPVKSSLYGVASLATNACEAETAADYTAVIVARRQAATMLRARKIPVETAERVQRLADHARAALDAACLGGKSDPAALASARSARARITHALEASHEN